MTTSRIAAIQRRAESAIARAGDNAAVASALRDAYTIELGEAEREEQYAATMRTINESKAEAAIRSIFAGREDLQASAMFWQGEAKRMATEVGRLRAKLTELTDFKAFNEAGVRLLTKEESRALVERCWPEKSR